MKIPMLSHMKIKTPNKELFERLGNVYPNAEYFFLNVGTNTQPIYNMLNNFLQETDVGNISVKHFWEDYLYSRYYKKLSIYMLNLVDIRSLTLKDDYYIMDSNDVHDNEVAEHIQSEYYLKWKKLFETYKIQYDIIRPYDMSINDTETEDINQSIDIERQNTGSSNDSGTDKVITDVTESSVYGFNSPNAVPSDKSQNTAENTNSSDSEYTNSGSTSTDNKRTSENNRTIKRLGNIGNITQQELIRQERELLNQKYIDILYEDLDKIFCSKTW